MRPSIPSRRRNLLLAAVAVFVLALLLRAGHLADLRSGWGDTHLFSIAHSDAAHHWEEARAILDEDFLLRDRVPWKGPGYSYFLAALIKVVGRSPANLRWVLALVGALNCAALVLVAQRLLPLPWCALAGALAAVNGVLILFDGELVFPTLLVALNLPVFYLFGRARPGPTGYVMAGALMGLSALVHPVYLVPALFLTAWILRRSIGSAAIFALAVASVVVPVSLKNVVAQGQPVLISWNGGINIYVANHPAFDQYSGNGTNAWVRVLQSTADAGMDEEHERDRYYYRLAARQLLDAPLTTAGILLRKAFILLSPVEYASNFRLYELREHSRVLSLTLGRWGPLWVPFGLWGPAALIGLFLCLRRPEPLSSALAWWCLGLVVSIVLSFNTARYRAPLVFFGCIFVAVAAREAWRAWRRGDRRRLAGGAGVYVVLAFALAASAVPQRAFPPPPEFVEASHLASLGNAAAAERWARSALAHHPEETVVRYSVGKLFGEIGLRAEGRALIRTAIQARDIEPDLVSSGHELIAESLRADGRLDEAREELEAALAVRVDEASWRGLPFFRLDLGPVSACWLRLQLAGIELDAGNHGRAEELVARVESDCTAAGRLRGALESLEARRVLSRPRLSRP